jgi:hypothetical protein
LDRFDNRCVNERGRIANVRAAMVGTTEGAKLTDEVNGTINAAWGGDGGAEYPLPKESTLRKCSSQ